ncbi:helix-turn-helix domain-containing protein [uncultured Tateyamaria sp.]|uniref:helix-turn-helix domain-containing protein n=1 Tax=uncultured Tateyamaria sp. TaxID=455651 RepID=UPI0026209D57|nr:XRE family transcriptional regulator [uncultured Tateyamaria sp.]
MTSRDQKKPARTATDTSLAAFGAEVRQLRKARQMTLAELATASGVSVSHLSAIERGTVSASLNRITRIADALGVPEEWFFNHRPGVGPNERAFVVRQSNRRSLNLLYGEPIEKAGYVDQLLSSSIGGQFYLGVSEYRPRSEQVVDHVFSRDGEIHGLVLDGVMELTIEDEVITVRAGDSFSFPGKILHLLRNATDKPARLIWVNSPVIIPRFAAQDTAQPMPRSDKKKSG